MVLGRDGVWTKGRRDRIELDVHARAKLGRLNLTFPERVGHRRRNQERRIAEHPEVLPGQPARSLRTSEMGCRRAKFRQPTYSCDVGRPEWVGSQASGPWRAA